MARTAICVFSLFLVCLLWDASAFPKEMRGPRMVATEPFFRHPDVNEGEVIEHTFEILNPGGAVLKIGDVKTDCGCATAAYDRSIPPGGKGSITLRIDTKGYQGKIKRSATIFANERRRKPLKLSIETVIKVPIFVSKGHVVFKGSAGEEITKAIDVRAETDKPLRLEVDGFDLEQKVTYRIEEIVKDHTYRIHFSNIPGPAERYHGVFTLKTNYPEKPEISIRIRARFRADKKS